MSSSKQKPKEGNSEVDQFAFVRQDIAIRKMLKEEKEETTIFKVNYCKHTNFAPEVTQARQ